MMSHISTCRTVPVVSRRQLTLIAMTGVSFGIGYSHIAQGAGAAMAPKVPVKASPKPTAKPAPQSVARLIDNLRQAINDARVEISVVPDPFGRMMARLDGTVTTKPEADAAEAMAKLFVPSQLSGVVSAINTDANAAPRRPGLQLPLERIDGSASGIENDIVSALGDDPRITVKAISLSSNHWVVRLDGEVPTAEERDGLLATAQAFVPWRIDRVASELRVSAKAPSLKDALKAKANEGQPTEKFETVQMVWPLTFGPESLTGSDGAALTGNRYEIPTLVTALNTAYKKASSDTDIVQATRHALLIRGQEDIVYQIRRDLVQLDAPGPQVQLDLWATQLSGKGGEPDAKQQLMAQTIKEAQRVIKDVPFMFNNAIGTNNNGSTREAYYSVTPDISPDPAVRKKNKDIQLQINKEIASLKAIHFDTNAQRRLTLPEMLIFLSIPDSEHETALFDHMGDVVRGYVKDCNYAFLKNGFKSLEGTKVFANGKSDNWKPFWRLREVYIPGDEQHATVRQTIIDFLEDVRIFHDYSEFHPESQLKDVVMRNLYGDWVKEEEAKRKTDAEADEKTRLDNAKKSGKKPEGNPKKPAPVVYTDLPPDKQKIVVAEAATIPNNPEKLARDAALVDSLFKIGADALAADIEEMVFQPLQQELKLQNGATKSSGGVGVVGRTRLVVTSGLQSSLKPTFQSSVDSTIPAPLDAGTLLGSAIPAAPAKDATLSGASRLLNGLPQSQAILLAGALSAPVVPQYTTVAPGVGITVRPTVFGDGASARLQIDASFGVESTAPTAAAGSNTWQPQPVDTVKSHVISTDATVRALDLFDISSFGMVTRHPRGPGYVPVLGRLPLIGPVFQWRRRDSEIEHNSTILVNTVILPRALDIVRYYSTP